MRRVDRSAAVIPLVLALSVMGCGGGSADPESPSVGGSVAKSPSSEVTPVNVALGAFPEMPGAQLPQPEAQALQRVLDAAVEEGGHLGPPFPGGPRPIVRAST